MAAVTEGKDDVRTPCVSCDRKTFHEVLYADLRSEFEYRLDVIHEMLKCRGCHTISFRKLVRDIESAYPEDDFEGRWYVPEEVTCYPSVLENHKELTNVWDVPEVVRDIYTQSVQAIKDQSNTLAGIGLRATIEAICNDRGIKGSNLEKRIDGLAKGGLIAQKDAERLHAIRFMGNDAAHEIKRADAKNLLIALRIIEHLLVNLYVLDNEADMRLDTIIKSFEKFQAMLDKKLEEFTSGDEIPIAKIFGRDLRRLHGHRAVHEAELIARIGASTYTKLSVGKVAKYSGSREPLQHFIVV